MALTARDSTLPFKRKAASVSQQTAELSSQCATAPSSPVTWRGTISRSRPSSAIRMRPGRTSHTPLHPTQDRSHNLSTHRLRQCIAASRYPVAYVEVPASETGQPVADPVRLIVPMLERFIATELRQSAAPVGKVANWRFSFHSNISLESGPFRIEMKGPFRRSSTIILPITSSRR